MAGGDRNSPDGGQVCSVRMRAAAGGPHEAGGRHVSGAERLVPAGQVPRVAAELARRALAAGAPDGADAGAGADFIQITVEAVPAERIVRLQALPVSTVQTGGWQEARAAAAQLLAAAGVDAAVAGWAVAALSGGLGPGGSVMRGGALIDAFSGRRLEADAARGVRVTRVDWLPAAKRSLRARLARHGLDHPRVADALALATKAAWAGVVAEIGWSDDPAYTTGYVAAPGLGYVRLPLIKPSGDPYGGRVFFVAAAGDVASLQHRLESVPVWIERAGAVSAPQPWESFWQGRVELCRTT